MYVLNVSICLVCIFVFQNAGPAPSPLGQMPPNDGMGPGGPIPPGFFPVSGSVDKDSLSIAVVPNLLCTSASQIILFSPLT